MINSKIAGITFPENLKNVLKNSSTLKDGILTLKHEPLTVEGKSFPNCINVYLGEDKVGSLPEGNEEAKRVQKLVVEEIAKKGELQATVSKLYHIRGNISIKMALEVWEKTGAVELLSAVIRETERKGNIFANKPEEGSFIGGIQLAIPIVNESSFREHPETGVVYKRVSAFLSENSSLIQTKEEDMRIGFWAKKFAVKDSYIKPGDRIIRIKKVNDLVESDYGQPRKELLDEVVKTSEELFGIKQAPFTFEYADEIRKVLDVTSKYGTEIHRVSLECLDKLTPEIQFKIDEAPKTTFNDFLRDFAPFDILSEESDKGQSNIVYDDTLAIAGEFDLFFKNGRDVNLSRVVRNGASFSLEPHKIPAGTSLLIDFKTGTTDGISKDGNYYEKAQKKHFLQVGFYGKNKGEGVKDALVVYLSPSLDGKATYRAVLVDVNEWYGYITLVKNGSRFDI